MSDHETESSPSAAGAVAPANKEQIGDAVKQPNLFSVLKDKENRVALKPLTRASVAMAVVPLGTMALFQQVVLPALGVDENREVWSGVAAIVMVNLVILGFTLFAFFIEKNDDTQQEELKKIN